MSSRWRGVIFQTSRLTRNNNTEHFNLLHASNKTLPDNEHSVVFLHFHKCALDVPENKNNNIIQDNIVHFGIDIW